MKKTPAISVLMSVYNGEVYLAEAIESILQQTFADFEFIIINDCSTDSTATILEQYSQNDSRIRVISNEVNLGLTKSLNIGLKECRGNYIARMDSDDISLPKRLEKQIQFMENNPDIGVCGTFVEKIGDDSTQLNIPVTHNEIVIELLFKNRIVHSSVMLRKEILKTNNLNYDESCKTAQDYNLWVKLISCTKFHNVDEVLVKYRIHNSQIGVSNSSQQSVDASKATIALGELILNSEFGEKEKENYLLFFSSNWKACSIENANYWLEKVLTHYSKKFIQDSDLLRIKMEKEWRKIILYKPHYFVELRHLPTLFLSQKLSLIECLKYGSKCIFQR